MRTVFGVGTVFVFTIILLAALVVNGCSLGAVVGSGKSMTETREVSNFDGVVMSFVGEMEIIQGDEEKLVITGDDNIVPLIRSEVRDGMLEIRTEPEMVGRPIVPLRYELTVKDLSTITLSGLADIHADALETEELRVVMSGAGNLAIDDLQADELSAVLSGLGGTELAGNVDTQKVVVSGAGNYGAGALASGVTDISLSGLGSATVRASEILRANITGAGSIEYYGQPEVSQSITGVGTIQAAGE
jgi:hypothetical protein